jgi:hypothetical protein
VRSLSGSYIWWPAPGACLLHLLLWERARPSSIQLAGRIHLLGLAAMTHAGLQTAAGRKPAFNRERWNPADRGHNSSMALLCRPHHYLVQVLGEVGRAARHGHTSFTGRRGQREMNGDVPAGQDVLRVHAGGFRRPSGRGGRVSRSWSLAPCIACDCSLAVDPSASCSARISCDVIFHFCVAEIFVKIRV